MTGVEGPLLAYKALLVVVVMMWVYRRFERVGPKDPALERACRRGRLLAALRAPHVDLARVAEVLARALPDDRTVLFGMGMRPWPWYAVRVRVAVEGPCVVVRAERAARLRSEGKEPPSAHRAIEATLAEVESAEAFLDPTLFVDLDSGARPRGGWRLVSGAAPVPVDEPPGWWSEGSSSPAHSAATATPEGRATRAIASTCATSRGSDASGSACGPSERATPGSG